MNAQKPEHLILYTVMPRSWTDLAMYAMTNKLAAPSVCYEIDGATRKFTGWSGNPYPSDEP